MDVVFRELRCPRWSAGVLTLALVAGSGCSSFQGTTAASFLKKVEHSRDPNERYAAYENLGSPRAYDDESQKERAVQVLSKKLEPRTMGRDDYAEPSVTRAMICRTLGKLGHPGARNSVLNAVNDADPLVRTEACKALARVGKPEDATILTRVMTADSSPDCRVAAIEALASMKTSDPRISGFLANAMESDEDPAIRLASLNALRTITGKDFGAEAKPWQDYLVATNPANQKPATANIATSTPPPRSTDPTVRQTATPR